MTAINEAQLRRIRPNFFSTRSTTIRDKNSNIIFQKVSGVGSSRANTIISKQGLNTPLTLERQKTLRKTTNASTSGNPILSLNPQYTGGQSMMDGSVSYNSTRKNVVDNLLDIAKKNYVPPSKVSNDEDNFLEKAYKGFFEFLEGLGSTVGNTVGNVVEGVGDGVGQGIGGAVAGAGEGVGDAVSGVGDGVSDFFEKESTQKLLLYSALVVGGLVIIPPLLTGIKK